MKKETIKKVINFVPWVRKSCPCFDVKEPLRYKVGGPSEVFARLCGMGPSEDGYAVFYCASSWEYFECWLLYSGTISFIFFTIAMSS